MPEFVSKIKRRELEQERDTQEAPYKNYKDCAPVITLPEIYIGAWILGMTNRIKIWINANQSYEQWKNTREHERIHFFYGDEGRVTAMADGTY